MYSRVGDTSEKVMILHEVSKKIKFFYTDLAFQKNNSKFVINVQYCDDIVINIEQLNKNINLLKFKGIRV